MKYRCKTASIDLGRSAFVAALGLSVALTSACGVEEATVKPGAETSTEALLGGARDIRGVALDLDNSTLAGPGLTARMRPVAPQAFVPERLFCDAFEVGLCGGLSSCGCAEEKEVCHDMMETECQGNWGMLGPQAQRALTKGTITYDGYAAYRLVRKLAEGAQACQSALPALEWTRRDLITFGGVFQGHIDNGAPCTIPFAPFRANECAAGICELDASGKGRCVEAVDVGRPCNGKTACFDMDARVSFRDFQMQTVGARCAPMESGEVVCQPHARVGARCYSDETCASGRCLNKTCAAPAGPGQYCRGHLDCESGYCADGACRVDALPLGATCHRGEQCQSEACYQGSCAEPICRR